MAVTAIKLEIGKVGGDVIRSGRVWTISEPVPIVLPLNIGCKVTGKAQSDGIIFRNRRFVRRIIGRRSAEDAVLQHILDRFSSGSGQQG